MKGRFKRLNNWLQSERGARVLSRLKPQLDTILPSLYGYHLLQVGIQKQNNLLDESMIKKHHFITPFRPDNPQHVQSQLHALPFKEKSIDLVFAPFSLELVYDTAVFLCELDRITCSGGHILFLGINPMGFWGYPGYLFGRHHFGMGHVTIFSATKLRRQLANLGFKTRLVQRFFYSPPCVNRTVTENMFEHLGQIVVPIPSGFYILLAQKTEMMAVRPVWSYGNYVFGRNTAIGG